MEKQQDINKKDVCALYTQQTTLFECAKSKSAHYLLDVPSLLYHFGR